MKKLLLILFCFFSIAATAQNTNHRPLTVGAQSTNDSLKFFPSYSNPLALADSLVAYGHSIIFGDNATVIPDSAYIGLMASHYGLPLNNHGIPSSLSFTAIQNFNLNVNPGHAAFSVFNASLNDIRTYGTSNLPNCLNECTNSIWSAVANQNLSAYTSGSDNTITTRTGAAWTTGWDANANAGGKTHAGAYNSTVNDSLHLTTAAACTGIVVSLAGNAGAGATVQVVIDGTVVDNIVTANQSATGTYQIMARIYTGLANTTHHVNLVNTTGNLMIVDYVGTINAASSTMPFLIMEEEHMDATGYATAPNQATQAKIDTLNGRLEALQAMLVGYGLKVYIAKTNTTYTATFGVDLSSDHIHPNNLGHREIFLGAIVPALSAFGSTVGNLLYGTDGFWHGTDQNSILQQIPYSSTITWQQTLVNSPNISANIYSNGNGYNFTLNNYKFLIDSTYITQDSLWQNGILGVYGPAATLRIAPRTTNNNKIGFDIYMGGVSSPLSIYSEVKSRDLVEFYNSYQNLFITDSLNGAIIPTATVEIAGNIHGLATHTPLKIDSGVLVSSPEKYAWEVNGTNVFWTNNALTRDTIGMRGWADAKFAPITSPTFTGTPAAPTAAAGTNTTQIATTAFVFGAAGAIQAGTDLTAQSGTVSSVATFTPSANGTFRIGTYVAITAISAGTLTMTVTYTDETSASRTVTFFPMGLTAAGLTSTGATAFPTADIRAKSGSAITVVATFSGVSITFDTGATISQLR